jgi:hypothetical protein
VADEELGFVFDSDEAVAVFLGEEGSEGLFELGAAGDRG